MSTWVVLSIRREMGTVGAQAEKIEEKRIEEPMLAAAALAAGAAANE